MSTQDDEEIKIKAIREYLDMVLPPDLHIFADYEIGNDELIALWERGNSFREQAATEFEKLHVDLATARIVIEYCAKQGIYGAIMWLRDHPEGK